MTATYRLQLHAGFTFADAEKAVPYLADLGVTHLYLSPILQAAEGSVHGYDVVDHSRVSDALGGQDGLEALAVIAREHGLGIVVDVVPNHMALTAPLSANRVLWDTLRRGPEGPTAHWFDVDWDFLDGRIGLPLLGRPLDEAIAAGELSLGEHEGEPVVRYFDHVFPVAAGTEGDDLAAVLARQHYLLASWREKDTVLNYRRFFDIDDLIAIRVEEPDVFEATHRVLLDLNRRGVIEGFRIDHPDGLADPGGYLRDLRRASQLGTAIWVEKILEGDERLPDDWQCDGTTGYDALRAVTGALYDPATAHLLHAAWSEAGGGAESAPVVADSKREVVATILGPERNRLTRRAREFLPDVAPDQVEEAVGALLVATNVYRAYARPGRPAVGQALQVIEQARDRAASERPDLRDVIGRLAQAAARPSPSQPAEVDFAVRLQQTWGPVMAKAVEDTTFYRWHAMIALNEVGGEPDLLDEAAPSILHDWAEHQQQHWPLGMTALSTHDTKRSEDVRARLIAVSGDAEQWAACSEGFSQAADLYGVDRPTAHLLWQTLVGVGDIDGERLHDYLVKATREAKQHTAWIDGDPDYEERVRALADAALEPGHLRALVDTAVEHNREAIRSVILGQKLLQLTLPGTPDTYQGCEIVNLSLVDPDNRRAVDYPALRRRLEGLLEHPPRDLDDEKLFVTVKTLALRKELRDSFGDRGVYRPLVASTRHLVGFTRGAEVAVAVTRSPQRLAAAGGWGDQRVTLPDGLWRDELSETLHEGGDVRCADLFEQLPVSLLRRVHI